MTAGSLQGTVTDAASGDPIDGATLELQPGGAMATSAADGTYAVPDVPAGVYALAFKAAGYHAKTITNVSITAGTSVVTDVALDVGSDDTTGTLSGKVARRAAPNDANAALSGATVALVDAFAFADSDAADPMEQLAAASPLLAMTDATGAYNFDVVPPGRYFVYVTPSAADGAAVFPGGDASRTSFEVVAATTYTADVTVSQRPPANATFLGSTVCLGCHNGQVAQHDLSGWKRSLHALVYRKPDAPTANQDLSQLPNHDLAMVYFKDSTENAANTRDNTGPGDGYGLRISKTSFPKFPANYDLLLGYDGKYFVQLAVPNGGAVSNKYYVEFTFGGHGLYKERWITRAATDGSYAATAGGASSYYILPFQYDEKMAAGVEPFSPYNPANWGPPTTAGGPAARPAQKASFDNNCAGCHFTGVGLSRDASGNFKAKAAHDVNGVMDFDGDGSKDEMDIGCESCHGPGSAHVAGGPSQGKNIVLPNLLAAERANLVCGQCHTRGEGHGTIGGDATEFPSGGLDTLKFPYPGVSRTEFLATFYVEKPGTYADDTQHSRQHHQQYIDHLKSVHNQNPYQAVTCDSCHNMHARDNGPSLALPASDNKLCLSCHAPYTFGLQQGYTKEDEGLAVSLHMKALAGMNVGYDPTNFTGVAPTTATGGVGNCAGCHMPKTAASQSRFMSDTLTGAEPTGARIRGDVSSHVFDVIMPATSEVLFTSGGANNQLPNSCGSCHNDVSGILPDYTW